MLTISLFHFVVGILILAMLFISPSYLTTFSKVAIVILIVLCVVPTILIVDAKYKYTEQTHAESNLQ